MTWWDYLWMCIDEVNIRELKMMGLYFESDS